MAEKRLAIIGGGFAGLATGCYARMNGYEVDIFEQHTVTGGLCAAWKRQSYTFDGCIHWFAGSDPNSPSSIYWRELGLLRDQTFVHPELFQVIKSANGERLDFFTDPKRLEAELLRIAPEDHRPIKEFIALLEKCCRPDSPFRSFGQGGIPKLLPWIPTFVKYGRMTIADFARKFKNPFLSWAFGAIWEYPDFAFIALPMTLAFLSSKNAGYPLGGSLRLAEALDRRARELGCRIHLGSRVEKVLVENNRAVGLRLASGDEHRADYVIGAGDLHSLIHKLLDGRYGSASQKGYFGRLPLFESIMLISYGVKRSFADAPQVQSGFGLQLPAERVLAGAPHKSIHYRVYNFDPTLAPEGRTVVQVTLNAPYEYWRDLKAEPSKYAEAKRRAADECAEILETIFPGFREDVEVIDVASPATFERYTSNWRGSFEGWIPTPKAMTGNMPKKLAGLDGLYLAGQWVRPGGGLPPSAMSGRAVVGMLCKLDGKVFRTEEV